jgi:hypothetical protein
MDAHHLSLDGPRCHSRLLSGRAVGGITGDTGADRRGERMTRVLSVYFGAVALLVAAVAIVRAFS